MSPAGPLPTQTPLYYGLQAERYSRQNGIREIQGITGRMLIVYTASLAGGAISADDIGPFTDLMYGLGPNQKVDFLLHTPGGDIDKAEKLVLLLRSKASHVRLIVPESAKSAGTLIACAADEILMSDTSELGPIDPQVYVVTSTGKDLARPAQSFLDGLEAIKEDVIKTGSLSPVYFPLLSDLDPALIDFCHKSIERSKRFATKWLSVSQCKGRPRRAAAIAKALCNTKKYQSHGMVIGYEEAKKLGLAVNYLPMNDPLWERFWRLYCMYDITLRRNNLQKIFEAEQVSISF